MTLRDPYGTRHACRDCEHWGGDIPDTNHAYCLQSGFVSVQADAKHGCVFWVRAIGSDDEAQQAKNWGR